MRIVISGLHRDDAVKQAELKYGVESINPMYPGMEDDEHKLLAYAAETFKYFSKKNVVFNGGVFDAFKNHVDPGWNDLQEQIILSSVINVDKIIIITKDMDERRVKFCESFAEMYPEKFCIVNNENEVVV